MHGQLNSHFNVLSNHYYDDDDDPAGYYGQGIIRVFVQLYSFESRDKHVRLWKDKADRIKPDFERGLWLLCMSRKGAKKSSKKHMMTEKSTHPKSTTNSDEKRANDSASSSNSHEDDDDEVPILGVNVSSSGLTVIIKSTSNIQFLHVYSGGQTMYDI